jgi:hypothetical protein
MLYNHWIIEAIRLWQEEEVDHKLQIISSLILSKLFKIWMKNLRKLLKIVVRGAVQILKPREMYLDQATPHKFNKTNMKWAVL